MAAPLQAFTLEEVARHSTEVTLLTLLTLLTLQTLRTLITLLALLMIFTLLGGRIHYHSRQGV
jgi:hypothetical protein